MILEYTPKIIKQKSQNFIKGKIRAWIFDHETEKSEMIHIQDYLSYQKNLNPNSYLYDLASTAVTTSPDMVYKYAALSTNYDIPDKTSSLSLEIARVVITPVRTNNKIVVESVFGMADGNTLQTSITAFSTRKNLTLTTKTGLMVGDACQIALPSGAKNERKITYINPSTNDIELDKELSEDPSTATSGNFRQMISRIHLVYGSLATLSLNTGFGASIAQLRTTKSSTQSIFARHEIEFLGS